VRKACRWLTLLAVLPLLSACGVYGPKSNDTGGIIPWSPAAQREAHAIAQENCGAYGKYAVITSVHRKYGDYIGYDCGWRPRYTRLRR
jgi:hypothetical protein